jgi:hypothetical protein
MQLSAQRCFVLAGFLAIFVLPELANAQKGATDLKSKIVDIDGFKSEAPKDWVRVKPSNLLRSYEFTIPKIEGDMEDIEFSVRPDVTGTDEQNILRAQQLFVVPEGQTVKDISKVAKMEVGKLKLIYVEVAGVYLKKKNPIDPDFKAVKVPGYRMYNVLVETPDNTHVIRVIGPDKSMQKAKPAFDGWLKAFKK